MRHCGIQPQSEEQRRPDARCPGAAGRDRRARRRRGRVRLPLPEARCPSHKQRTGASAVLDRIAIPADARQVLLHVRDYTKGHPQIAANNHPVRHGTVAGVHNGTILNDDELMARHGFERAEPGMTVDSEVIFATAEATGSDARAFEDFRGSMAAAWLDERHPELLYLARGVGRPLWVGTSRRELFFASTVEALEIAERYTVSTCASASSRRGRCSR